MTSVPSPAAPDGRDDRGRFTTGNSFGKGCPTRRRAAAARRALLEVLHDDLPHVVAALVERARTGDVAAIRTLFERAMGQPRQAPADAAELDLGPLDSLDQVVAATARLARAVASDEIDAQRGMELLGFLSEARAAVEAKALVEIDERLRRLEGRS